MERTGSPPFAGPGKPLLMHTDSRLEVTVEFDVFGTRMIVERSANGWVVSYPPRGGKRREVPGILVPPDLPEESLAQHLADLFHDNSSPTPPDVKGLK